MRIALNYRTYLVFFILVSAVLLIRIGDINFLDGRYLWAEDGNIFINQALSLGLESILNPYAGYIHLYPRLISLLAVQFDLIFLPTIFFMAWLGAVLYSSFVVFQWLYKQTKSMMTSMIIPLLILLQPHSGETFFNITNAQWFLPLALIVLLIDKDYQVSYKNFFVLIILGLTGPFSILLLPILFLSIIIKKDLKNNYLKYFLIISTAFIQIYFMMKSNRVGGDIDTNIIHWAKSFYIFLTFGTKGLFAILSILVWITIFAYLIKIFFDIYKKEISKSQMNGFLLIIGLFIIYFAGLWSTKQFPLALHPMGGGARYFVIPYALLILSLPLLIQHVRVFYMLLFVILMIFVKQFIIIDKKKLNYQSFVWFAQYNESLDIPIHPQWGTYPGWHIDYKNKDSIKEATAYTVKNDDLKILNLEILSDGSFKTTSSDAQLLFSVPNQCNKSNHIGVKVSLERENKGWSQIFYATSDSDFSEQKSLKRFYDSGNIEMNFAFKNNNINNIRFDPTEQKEKVKINSIKLFCEGYSNEFK